MSRKVPSVASRDLLIVLALAILRPITAQAADPNAPPRQTPAAAKPAAQALPRPSRPATRSPASFTPEMTFTEAVDILRHSTSPPINIVVLWNDIRDNAGIYRETPIGIDGMPGLRVRQHLDLLTLSLSAGASAKLGYTINNGVVTIATVDSLPKPKYTTRVYDVSDLVAPPAQYFLPPMMFGGMGYGGMGYGGMGYGGMGYGGMGYGGQMGAGGLGGGYGVGGMYMPGSSYGAAGLSGFVGSVYGNGGGSGYRRR